MRWASILRQIHRRFPSSARWQMMSAFELSTAHRNRPHCSLGILLPQRRFFHRTSPQQSILEISSRVEPPLDCEVLEKPCTVVLMEDERSGINVESSWLPSFQTRIPTECGMSFATISFSESNDDNSNDTIEPQRVSDCLNALKNSSLPRIHDAVLVARGPFSSLCAQYYLESLSLQGLIMVDPILMGKDAGDEEISKIEDILKSNCNFHRSDWERFQSSSLLLEPNAVPMMVILTKRDTTWNTVSLKVAERHSYGDGPYGKVKVVDLMKLSDASCDNQSEGDLMVNSVINDWIDNNVL